MSIKKIIFTSIFISLLSPFIVFAQVKITEIMYDPEGTDTKREWIEVYNEGNTSIDLSTYFLFENNIYHKLVAQEQSIINSGEYAIIVDSIPEVLMEYKDYVGKIFDSTFSLNNTGESISIADYSKQNIDTVTYDNSMGGNNVGTSIQINGETIIQALPTFGLVNALENYVPVDRDQELNTTNESDTNSSSHIQQESIGTYTPPAQFKIGIGRNRIVTIHTPIEFTAQISKKDVKPRINWNFGDFSTDTGRKTEHTYKNEGIYQVLVEGTHGGNTAISRTQVTVIVPEIDIIQSTSSIAFKNKGKTEVNIGNFLIRFFDNTTFKIPRNTIIKSGITIYKNIEEGQVLKEFVYPNSEIYERFGTI